MQEPLRRSIIQTLCYFDIFSYPLTRTELSSFLWSDDGSSRENIFDTLDEEFTQVQEKGGYVYLTGREETITQRERRVWHLEQKMDIARGAVKKMRWVPFVKAVFVCNQLPVTAKSQSDIDVFIVVQTGRLWLTRLFVTGVLSIFQLRRHGVRIENHVCLSFYCTEDALDLQTIALDEPDIYLAYWVAWLIPVFDPFMFQRKIWEHNSWVRQYLPQYTPRYSQEHRWHVKDSRFSRTIRMVQEKMLGGSLGNTLEKLSKKIQQAKMKRSPQNVHAQNNTHVVISDAMLKFHENDRRAYYKEELKKRCDMFV